MSVTVTVRNRQRGRRVDVVRLRRIGEALIGAELGLAEADLGVTLVSARAMALLNWRWLRHEGSTDILTFDESDLVTPGDPERPGGGAGGRKGETGDGPLRGELFVSVDDAVVQAREFGTRPGAELVRYLVHGVLHLRGYDDLDPDRRRVMKREENRLVRRLAVPAAVRGLLR